MTTSGYHAPVLLDEVVGLLANAKSVLDGTLGGGGHSEALLMKGAEVVGIDRDPEAVAAARARLASQEKAGRFRAVQTTYDAVDESPDLAGRKFDGVLLDLGVSSRQFDAEPRGFTFREGAPLDMRMGTEGETAADVLNDRDDRELAQIFKEYGDEPRSARLAREVVRRRAREPFATSDDLVKAIRGALGPRSGPSDFARLFQALRIAVNDELEGLRRALPALRDRLNPGGVMAIITYHSGEDRIVKNSFRDWSTACVCPPKQPVCTCGGRSSGETLTRKPILPTTEEISSNPRARSAKLRAWRRAD
jgi:16S rRNA (cytosine1402-N4)-methyltransferase